MDTDVIGQNIGSAQLNVLTRTTLEKGENSELKEACQGFEAIFLNSMMKSMRTTLPGDALFEESHGMGIYESMHDKHLTESIARGGSGIGIGEYLYNQLQEE